MALWRWFLSRTVRQAVDLSRQLRRLARAQQDLLPRENLERLHACRADLRRAIETGASRETLAAAMQRVEQVAQQNLRPYPHPRWRENIEVFLVTGAVVLALRTFFFQPMAIPSGSAQPTLYGIVTENLKDRPEVQMPPARTRWFVSWWYGVHYYHVVARRGGELTAIEPARRVLPLVKRQVLRVGGERYTIWFPPENLASEAGLRVGDRFAPGDDIVRLRSRSGDHLCVNRVIYNFRPPRRGEIVVFASHRLRDLIPDTHYIKRLVALSGERVRIGNDRHLVINGTRLDASTPGFENLYGFNPKDEPRESQYSGHVNGAIMSRYRGRLVAERVAPLFPDENAEFVVPRNRYLALGDNTMNSHDGRAWGTLPREYVIGRASFVFWPISERFGWGYR
jgi:signal peptidase I